MDSKYMEKLTKKELEKLYTIAAKEAIDDYINDCLDDAVVEYYWIANEIGIPNFRLMYLGKNALRLVNHNLKENNVLLKIDTGIIDAYVHIRMAGDIILVNIYEDMGDGTIELESCLKLIAVSDGEEEGFEYYKYDAITGEDGVEEENDIVEVFGMLKIVGDSMGLEDAQIIE